MSVLGPLNPDSYPQYNPHESVPYKPLIPANATQADVHLAVVLALGAALDVINIRRNGDKLERWTQMDAQSKGYQEVKGVYNSQATWAIFTGILSGALGIAGGVSTGVAAPLVGVFSGVDMNALTDAQKGIADMITKVLSASSQVFTTSGDIVRTCKEGERYVPQTNTDKARQGYDDFTRQLEEALQSKEGIKSFILNYLQTRQDIARQTTF